METARYRCGACGNRTRFDVVATRRTRAFHHYSIGGDLTVQDEDVLSEVVEEVSCRWCGSGGSIEVVQGPERPDGAGETGPERPDGAGETGPERPDGAGETGPERPDAEGGLGG